MLKIRLQRTGRKNDPAFRVVLTDSKNATKSGKFLEILGSYNVKSGEVLFKGDRIKEWIKNGAQVSDTVHNFLVSQKIIEGKKKNSLSRKSPTVKRKELKKA
jgi:small subunit ribosomal protein S16